MSSIRWFSIKVQLKNMSLKSRIAVNAARRLTMDTSDHEIYLSTDNRLFDERMAAGIIFG